MQDILKQAEQDYQEEEDIEKLLRLEARQKRLEALSELLGKKYMGITNYARVSLDASGWPTNTVYIDLPGCKTFKAELEETVYGGYRESVSVWSCTFYHKFYSTYWYKSKSLAHAIVMSKEK